MGRILVIGATGLIGLPVAGRLLADGHQVRLLVRDTGRASQRLGEGFEYAEGSVTDTETVDRAMQGMNGVHVSLGVEDPSPRQRPGMAWSGSATSPGAWSGWTTGRRSPSTGPSSQPNRRSKAQAFPTPSSARPTSPTRCRGTSRADSSSCSAASARCCTRCAPRTSPPRSPARSPPRTPPTATSTSTGRNRSPFVARWASTSGPSCPTGG